MRPTYSRAALAVGGGTALASQVHAQGFAAAHMFFGTGQPLTFAATSGQALRSPGIKDDLVKLVFLAAVVVVSTAGAVAAQTSPVLPDIEVTNAWARATVGAMKTGAAYLTLTDNGQPDLLTGASTPVADMTELHHTINANGVMQMRPVADLPLETGKSVTLAPGGYHVMFFNLKRPLQQGEAFPLTLTFEHAKPITVQVQVAGPGASGPTGSMSEMHDMPVTNTGGSHKP